MNIKTVPKICVALLLGVLLLNIHNVHASPSEIEAVVFFNEACSSCTLYINETLIPTLESKNITNILKKDYINERENRAAYNVVNEELSVPLEFREHIEVIIDNRLILSGHIPKNVIEESIALYPDFQKLLVYQKEMHKDIIEYTIWGFEGPYKTYTVDTPLEDYSRFFEQNKETFSPEKLSQRKKLLLPLILWSGLIDGVNPCAIAVLIFFIAFLFTLKASIGKLFRYGLVYIGVIYLVYLGIGLGLLKAIVLSEQPHLMAQIGSWLVIILGSINVINFYVPKFPLKLQIPKFSQRTLKHWLTKATLPAVVIAAFLVGLCTFPCSGGIYVAIISLLASQKTFWSGFGYLLIYNIMFILPLIVLLALIGNKYVIGRVAEFHSKADRQIKLWSGIVMIALGVIILLWFI